MKQSARRRAWRNLMVAAINSGLERGLFTTAPGPIVGEPLRTASDYRPGAAPDYPHNGCIFSFELPDGTVVRVSAANIGWDEISLHVAANPSDELLDVRGSPMHVTSTFVRAIGCDAYAEGWFERRTGPYLMVSDRPRFAARAESRGRLANLMIEPKGYKDSGKFII
jgi:hypothetical protein